MERYNEYWLGADFIKYINYLLAIILVVVIINSSNRNNKYERIIKNINIVEEDSIKTSIDKIYDSVLVIESYFINGTSSTGSGFIYKKDNRYGYIITNYHVVKDSESVRVINSNLEEYSAKVLGYDELTDLAILGIDTKYVESIAKLSSSTYNIGDTVFTIGAPQGKKFIGTVTKGIISGLNREMTVVINDKEYIVNVIQTDAPINPGNSGGPLVNINGEVIGINSLKIVTDEVEGMGFALPIEEAMLYTDKLEKGMDIVRPYLGIELKNINNNVVISSIKINAIETDLKVNDIIVSIDNVEVHDTMHFRYQLYKHNIGDKIDIEYIRNNKKYKTKIVLKKRT